jgi:hypothetical protein
MVLKVMRAARLPQNLQTSGGHVSPSFCSRSATRFSRASIFAGAARIGPHSDQRSKAFMTSSSNPTTTLHQRGLYREETAIAAVNVSCGGGRIGLLVQDAKGYAALLLGPDEAAHVASLLSDSVAKLTMPDTPAK